MRNGNSPHIYTLPSSVIVLILPMRNGNEEILYENDWNSLVLILPMRNGNTSMHWVIRLQGIQFLSYLWGMETRFRRNRTKRRYSCSYPTYEEWKPGSINPCFFNTLGSYPTYEEWKHFTSSKSSSFLLISSYPTYEEWKLQIYKYSWLFIWSVLILPMRNGNNTTYHPFPVGGRFLSYLWGMETMYWFHI